MADKYLRRPWEVFRESLPPHHHHIWTTDNRFSVFEGGQVHGGVDEVLRTLLLAVLLDKTWSGTFFITSDGHLGIGPESTQPGDQIVVLDGARSPFVLRALEGSSDCALIGDSFVLGLMHGEVRDLDARGKLQFEEIVLQ